MNPKNAILDQARPTRNYASYAILRYSALACSLKLCCNSCSSKTRRYIFGLWHFVWPSKEIALRQTIVNESQQPFWRHAAYKLRHDDRIIPIKEAGYLGRAARLMLSGRKASGLILTSLNSVNSDLVMDKMQYCNVRKTDSSIQNSN